MDHADQLTKTKTGGKLKEENWKIPDKSQTINYKRFWQSYETKMPFIALNHASKLREIFMCVFVSSTYEAFYVLHAIYFLFSELQSMCISAFVSSF